MLRGIEVVAEIVAVAWGAATALLLFVLVAVTLLERLGLLHRPVSVRRQRARVEDALTRPQTTLSWPGKGK